MKFSDLIGMIIIILVFGLVIGLFTQCSSYLTGGTVLKDIGETAGEIHNGYKKTQK